MAVNVLLTGGTGFIGINIAEVLANEGCHVVVYSKRPMLPEAAGMLAGTPGGAHWVRGDVLSKEALARVMEEEDIHMVVHAAAVTPDEAYERSHLASVLEINCLGSLNVLEAAKTRGVKRFVYVSSVAVYGDTPQRLDVVPEDAPMNPRNGYEISKYATERLICRYAELHGVEAAALRIGDAFGAWEYHSGVRFQMSAPFQAVFRALSGERAVLPKPGRTGWIYGRDTALAVKALLEAPALRHFAYNCGGIFPWSIEEFCEALKASLPGFECAVDPALPGNVSFFSAADNGLFSMDRIREDTGFVPRYGLSAALGHYVPWILQHPQLILTKPGRGTDP